ncbi:MAG: bestrophin-like domain [Acidimicrobiales bacterium]
MTSWPIGALAALVVVGSVVFAAVGVVLSRRFLHHHVFEGHNDVLVPIFLTAGTLYAVLLAFLVIVVWEQYGSAKTNINDESAVLATLYRQTDGVPSAERVAIRADLRRYTNAVIDEEFSVSAAGQGDVSDDARKAIADIYHQIGTLTQEQVTSPINVELVHNLSVLSADRSKRLIETSEEIPAILWVGMVLGAIVVVGMTFMLYMESRWPHIVMSSVLAGFIGLLLFVTLVLDRPFTGQLRLKPDALEHALAVFDSVDGGN